MIKILLVDDEPLLTESLEIILTMSGNYKVIGKAINGVEALAIIDGECPDVMLVDLNMPQMGGIELITKVHEIHPEIKMIVLTTFYDERNISRAIAGGASGYLLKDSGKDMIIEAVEGAIKGRSIFDSKVMDKLTHMMATGASTNQNVSSDILENKNLTDRECEICDLLKEGCTNSQIADMLFISEGTVKNYMSSIYDKFDVHDRAKLVLMLRGK
ncbi:MAG: response regulator transcription factor [Saccharofermentans sp.]|nr:response regulator transcription factor [Saccharofermentans sp.]